MGLELKGDPDNAPDIIDPVVDRVDELQNAHPGYYIGSFGTSTGKAVEAGFFDDLKKAGEFSVPLTLIILVVAFGALVAAGIPLLLALTAVLGTLGIVALISQVLPMSESVSAIILLIGLAVGVDYTMFYLKREREERAKGLSEEAALEAAAATSGRSVLISGSTVIVAMAGMFLTGDSDFASFGAATITVVAVAMLGSLTVLPGVALEARRQRRPASCAVRAPVAARRRGGSVLGSDHRSRAPAPGSVGRSRRRRAGCPGGARRPAPHGQREHRHVSAEPLEDVQPHEGGVPGHAGRSECRGQGAERRIAGDAKEAIGQLKWRALYRGVMYEPIDVDVNEAKTVANISIPVKGSGTDSTSNKALAALRDEIVPVTVGSVPDAVVGVTGETAQSKDFNDQMKTVAPLVFGFVLLFAFVLMLLSFRSLVIAAKTIVLNLLSVGAAYGILVLVFQHGWGKQLLGFEFTGGIDPFLPILLFVILFGLSMDYHVFVLSRVREGYESGMTTDEAVAHGIKSTAGVVTSAAIVMVGVFAIFATLQMMIFKQFGVGLASAILIDATLIRAILLPATMKLLGDWNWYLPKWLEWLPRLEHEKAPEAPAAPVAGA